MGKFVIKELVNCNLKKEIENIGFDKTYAKFVVDKYDYKTLKIFSLTPPQANILKQTALSLGADCATHREVITNKVEISDCILGGSISTLKKIATKLELQPFGLKDLANEICKQISLKKQPKTQLVGILNLTQNSFSDGGLYYDVENAKEKFVSIIEEGADIIDIGAESTKPFSEPVSAKKQLEKLLPILEFSKSYNIPISIDTRSSEVANEVLKLGDYIINDVSGLEYDKKMLDVIAKNEATVIIQHSLGTPETMQVSPIYQNLTDDIFRFLYKKAEIAKEAGINNIILDVGIGFGKTQQDNIELIKRIKEFKSIGYPLMLGVSRKSFLGVNENNNDLKDCLTLAYNALAIQSGVEYIRVHNVKLHREFLNSWY